MYFKERVAISNFYDKACTAAATWLYSSKTIETSTLEPVKIDDLAKSHMRRVSKIFK